MPTSESSESGQPCGKSYLIASDDAEPTVKLQPGMRFEVQAITVVDTELKASQRVAARLCGGTSTCLALVEVSSQWIEELMCALSPSRYNFAVCGKGGGVALFNASTGSTVRLDGPHAQLLADSLLDPKTTFSGEEFAPDLASQLRRGSFLGSGLN